MSVLVAIVAVVAAVALAGTAILLLRLLMQTVADLRKVTTGLDAVLGWSIRHDRADAAERSAPSSN